MKAILIDTKNREVKEVEIGTSIEDIYKHIGCQYFTIATYLNEGDAIFVDDEGLMNGTQTFFTYKGAHQPFAGNGMIIGSNEDGESVECKTDIDEVKNSVEFYDRYELAMAIAFGKIKLS